MGKILVSVQNKKEEDIFIDFEDAKPTSEEQATFDSNSKILSESSKILDRLFQYEGCEEHIRRAIQNPSQETEQAAWDAVLPAVDTLEQFFQYSSQLEQVFPKLLVELCVDDPKATMKSKQSLAYQLAQVFDFVLKFDDAKMVNPAIQNDFSYYRRTLNRMKLTKKDLNIKVRDELANRMSLFFAYPTPMMKVLSDSTTKFLQEGQNKVSRDEISQVLAIMANVCQNMVANKKFPAENTQMFCLRAMVGSIILYDHVHPQGAFHKKSPIRIHDCITTLKQYSTSTNDGLLNAIRFTTIHLSDSDTPSSIKKLLV